MNNHIAQAPDVPIADSSLKVLSWNINHIKNSLLGDKTEIEEVNKHLSSATIFCLQETKGDVTLQNYRCLNSLRQDSRSGGICIGVHRSIEKHTKLLDTGHSDFQAIEIAPSVTGLEGKTLLINVYDSPENSSYKLRLKDHGFSGTTLDALTEFLGKHNYDHILMVGDFNARTGSLNFRPRSENWKDPRDINTIAAIRASRDTTINARGEKLLDMLSCCNLSLLNGCTTGDVLGDLTCLKYNGASVVDYMMASSQLLSSVRSFKVLPMTTQSDHRPVICKFYSSTRFTQVEALSNLYDDVKTKPKWSEDIKQEFIARISSDSTILEVDLLLKDDIISKEEVIKLNNEIVGFISESVRETLSPTGMSSELDSEARPTIINNADDRKKRLRKRSQKSRPKHKWFDASCIQLKRELNRLSTKYSRKPFDPDIRAHFYSAKKEYRKTLKRKKDQYKQTLNKEILEDGKISWKRVKELKSCDKSIAKLDLFDIGNFSKFFKDLYSKRNCSVKDVNVSTMSNVDDTTDDNLLNSSILPEDITGASKNLKNGKAVGIDTILNEQLKCCCESPVMMPLLCKLFNECLDKGIYPWNTTVITPLFKKGDVYDPDCYRAIAVGSNLGKLFSQILLDRLVKFRAVNFPDTANQLGFCKGAQTVDHIFTLNTCIEKYVHVNKSRLYTCFVDYRKAFDSIPREALLYKLKKYGIKGKFYECIAYMYQHSNARLKMSNKLSELINIEAGTEQGHTLSPELFKIYVHDLSIRLNNLDGYNCPVLSEVSISHLLWADDLVLMACDKPTLQLMLNELYAYCLKWGLEVNTKKTAILVFNKSGKRLKESDSFIYNEVTVPSTKEYCYLGITLSASGSFTSTLKNLKQKGYRAYFGLKKCIDLRSITKVAVTKLIDALILPVVTYGSPIWFAKTKAAKFLSDKTPDFKSVATDPPERLHLAMLKWTMGVGKYTSNAAVWGDFGRHPVLVNSIRQIFNYMNRLRGFSTLGIPNLARYAFEEQMKCELPWIKRMNDIIGNLDKNRLDKSIPNATLMSARGKAQFVEYWNLDRRSNRKLTFYNLIKKDFTVEPYLTMPRLSNSHLIAKIRSSSHRLKCETGRYGMKANALSSKICPSCSNEDNMELLVHLPFVQPIIEDELHFLRTCPRYTTTRDRLKDVVKTALFKDPADLFCKEILPMMDNYMCKLFKERF